MSQTMKKKTYMKPLIEAVVSSMETPLLASSGLLTDTGVQSTETPFDIDFGGIDLEGMVVPQ